MKIGEVCERTGLTKRAVRFYIECGLVDPEIVERNFKEYREYSAADEARLRTIAVLRQSQFTIEQIKRMFAAPKEIPEVLGEYRAGLSNQEKELSALREGAEALLGSTLKSADDVAALLNDFRTHGDPDMTPHFRRYDDESTDEQVAPKRRWLGRAILSALVLLALVIGTCIGAAQWNDWVNHPVIGGERAKLVEHSAGQSIYYAKTFGLITVELVEEQNSYHFRDLVSSTAASTYTVALTGGAEGEILYTYRGNVPGEVWTIGAHDMEGFTLGAPITAEKEGVTRRLRITDPHDLTEEQTLVTDAITALRNYQPLWRMMVLPLAVSLLGSAVLWFLLKKLLKI